MRSGGLRTNSSIAVVSVRKFEGRQPGLPANGPAFVRGRELVGRVEAADMQLELVAEAIEQRRAASRTEAAGLEFARLTGDGHRVDGEDGECVKYRALPLAAIQAMTDSNAIGRGGDLDSHRPAHASTAVVRHGRAPFNS